MGEPGVRRALSRGHICYVTGTDTGVGKTFLACLLARQLADRGHSFAAIKPLCSGGPEEVARLEAAQWGNGMQASEICPWLYQKPLAPAFAARLEGRRVPSLQRVARYLDCIAETRETLLVEGAGGVGSPLGLHYDLRDLIQLRPGRILLVASNQLGVLGHLNLCREALEGVSGGELRVVLMQPVRAGEVHRENWGYLRKTIAAEHLFSVPRLKWNPLKNRGLPNMRKKDEKTLVALADFVSFSARS